ncbi:hypothetical protein CJF30_00003374 [Rutstroemia sp. NJR-2017a BBW]|nr:hypothetical protein CJF30_00003374 [Rutstroemia sp. NJR-2017a BBW]
MSTSEASILGHSLPDRAAMKPENTQSQVVNPDCPDHRFQIGPKTLFEQDFPYQEAFISASLTRLQHGIYDDEKRLSSYGPSPHNVTFVAVTIDSKELESAFKRSEQEGVPRRKQTSHFELSSLLRILRLVDIQPRIYIGPFRWVRASLGVTTPMTTTITPSTEFDRSKVIGTMLKIQGSTRSVKDMESSKLIWSLEENEQQYTGLPREFTFVFLVEQPVARAPFTLQVAIRPVLSQTIDGFKLYNEVVTRSHISSDEVGQKYVSTSHGPSLSKGAGLEL